MNIWAIIPVKPLRDGKSRLSHILSGDERAELTSQMLRHTIDILEDVVSISRTLVVSRDPAALKIARQQGASTYGETEKQDMNVALMRAGHIAAAQKADCILILPSDLPFLTVDDVEMVLAAAKPEIGNGNGGYYYAGRFMAICTDQNSDGTNALFICPPTGFNFKYGIGSFNHHLAEGDRQGMICHVVQAPGLKFDLDTEEDWRAYKAKLPSLVLNRRATLG
jgi:2-phospho-L-lactate guanylyltransferase